MVAFVQDGMSFGLSLAAARGQSTVPQAGNGTRKTARFATTTLPVLFTACPSSAPAMKQLELLRILHHAYRGHPPPLSVSADPQPLPRTTIGPPLECTSAVLWNAALSETRSARA